jgi:translation initiation factor 5
MERLKLFLSANPTATTEQICDELRNIQTMASLRPADRIIIYLGAVFTENMVAEKEVEKHADVLRALAASAIQQRHLIAAFEWLCGTRYPSRIKYFPILLKQLLDEELVEEDTFLAWAADFTRNEYSAEQSMVCLDTLEQLKASAQPFITWLMEAEVEGESSEGEDEEEDSGEGSDEA